MGDDSDESFGGILGRLAQQGHRKHHPAPAIVALFATVGLAQAEKLSDRKDWGIWVALGVIFIAITFGGEAVRRRLARWRVPKASGRRIGLLLARLQGAKSVAARDGLEKDQP